MYAFVNSLNEIGQLMDINSDSCKFHLPYKPGVFYHT